MLPEMEARVALLLAATAHANHAMSVVNLTML